ncbi:hypothetical protein HA402_011964 [Bradysia odoriphaga]|nr:hypothetical protein HA402_011964 [Bradysia odoriphaga]
MGVWYYIVNRTLKQKVAQHYGKRFEFNLRSAVKYLCMDREDWSEDHDIWAIGDDYSDSIKYHPYKMLSEDEMEEALYKKLREAIEGSGTDEQCIIDIITTRSNAQRQEIAALDRDLIDDLNSKLSGKCRDIIIGLMNPLNEYLCNELHKSLSGMSTDDEVLVEILCTKNNKEMAELIVAYDNC